MKKLFGVKRTGDMPKKYFVGVEDGKVILHQDQLGSLTYYYEFEANTTRDLLQLIKPFHKYETFKLN